MAPSSSYLETARNVYKDAALSPQAGLCCTTTPIWKLPDLIIPEIMLEMNYGCGSTVHPRDLADNPTVAVSTITNSKIIPYLPNQATSMPQVTSLVGTKLNILVNVSPPVINGGNGVTYDPSGSSNDSLWDVGE